MKVTSLFKSYPLKFLPGDISAGLTVGVMLIPQGMAYAMLAGLPPIYGLYSATVPLLMYALAGSFPKLAVGPTAISSILIASGLSGLATTGSENYISLAFLLALLVGLTQLLMGIVRFGNLMKYLHPVALAGFTAGVAVLVAVAQLDHLLGIQSKGSHFWARTTDLISEIPNTNMPTLGVGLLSVLLLWGVKKIHPKIPGQILLVLLGIGAAWCLGLQDQGVRVLGNIPEGLPNFLMPVWDGGQVVKLIPTVITIALLSFIEAMAINTALQMKYGTDDVRPNHEFMALGAANLAGSFFQCFAVSGGLSRTAVNDDAGAQTRLASLISVVIVILTLLFLTDYFYHLPEAVLAAIIFVAILGLIDIKSMKKIWKESRPLFLVYLITAICSLFLGVTIGIAVGIGLSGLHLLLMKNESSD